MIDHIKTEFAVEKRELENFMKTKKALFAVLIIVIATLACQALQNRETQIVTVVPRITLTTPARPTQAKFEIYDVGDAVEINNNVVTLNSVEITSESLLKANVTLENKGNETTYVDINVRFAARDNDGVVLEPASVYCPLLVNAEIIPGDKLKGDICWKATSSATFKIYYEDVWVANPIVWEISP